MVNKQVCNVDFRQNTIFVYMYLETVKNRANINRAGLSNQDRARIIFNFRFANIIIICGRLPCSHFMVLLGISVSSGWRSTNSLVVLNQAGYLLFQHISMFIFFFFI